MWIFLYVLAINGNYKGTIESTPNLSLCQNTANISPHVRMCGNSNFIIHQVQRTCKEEVHKSNVLYVEANYTTDLAVYAVVSACQHGIAIIIIKQ